MSGIITGPHLIGELALAEALKHLGVKEDPPKSNLNPFGKWFGSDGVAWCAQFVSFCFAEGASFEICSGFKGMGVRPGKGCSWVPSIADWLKASNFWVGRSEPCPGDIAIYNWDGQGIAEHIGIVERSTGGGHFDAVEGNTSVSNASNGGEVRRCDRHLSQVDGFGRIVS